MARRIIQFGTSRFLQAHVDLFVHEAREAGQDIGPITVVKTTPGSERAGRVAAFRDAAGFPVRIRGMRDQALVDETVQVRCVDQALSVAEDWAAVKQAFIAADIVVSNVGDKGYDRAEGDLDRGLVSDGAPPGYPAKLLQLLFARYRADARPLLILPCELMPANGQALSRRIDALAAELNVDSSFRAWIDRTVTFADTLVDRIVSEAIEPAGAIAEPYALWAIRCNPAAPPFRHPAIVYTDNLEPYARVKLHILNLGHTVLAETWLKEHRPEGETVRAILADEAVSRALTALYHDEVVPGFAANGMAEEAALYVRTTLERFRNPFLDHRIRDIAQNHEAKVDLRTRGFLAWIGGRAAAPRLRAICDARG